MVKDVAKKPTIDNLKDLKTRVNFYPIYKLFDT